ncbi:MAG: anti-sigma F factor [Clostridia bacterium]|nr:anti-sigma F factor [Clostridia bacterium]
MKKINECRMTVDAKSVNEGFCRAVCAAFAAQAEPTVEEIGDIKTAVSEAVTNCIVHAYREMGGKIYITASLLADQRLRITVRDRGCGIADVKQAMEPLFTTVGDDRSGLGFSVMETFSDKLTVRSKVGKGTTVIIEKKLRGRARD